MKHSLKLIHGNSLYKLNLYLFIYIIIINSIFANDQLRIINADYLESINKNNQNIQKLHGNVILKSNDLFLYTQDANYYPDINEFHLINDVIMIKNNDTLKCEKMIYFDNKSFLKAKNNVNFFQTNKRISCDSLYYWSDLDSSIAFNNVTLNQKNTTIISDQLSFWKTNGFRGSSFIAQGNSQIKEGNKTITANEIFYNDSLQLMSLNDNCIINDYNRGLSGNKIYIQYSDSIITSVEVIERAAAYNDIWAYISKKQKYRDTMFSKKIYSKFTNNKISELTLIGMAKTSYHVIEDSLLKGQNNASGDSIQINFLQDEINRFQIFGGGQGMFKPEKNNTQVDSIITYNAEYIDYQIPDKKTFLKKNASVNYQNTHLSSGFITADWDKNLLEVYKNDETIPIVDTNNGEPLSGDYMEFNLITKHGRIVKGKTTFNNSLYYGNEIYRDDPNIFHVQNSKYTSCDAEEPHFYLASKKMKMITGDRVVAKPLWLYIFDIPIIGFPLAVFPNKGGQRHSGWIMPSFGHRNSDGTFFQGLGYYWAPNDYLDSRLMMNFYDKKGIKTFSTINYVKRYKYNGSLNSTLSRTIMSNNISNIIDGNLNQKWDLKWRHYWKIDPTQNLNINWTYMSNNSYYQDTTFSHSQETRLNQRLESSANYSKQWTESKNSLSLNISESIDLLKAQKSNLDLNPNPNTKIIYKSRYLPRLSLRHSQSKLFGNGTKWYNNIYWSISTSMTRIEKTGWESDSNSVWNSTNIKDNTDEIISHSIIFSAPQKYLGWLTLNPKLNIKEDWIFKYRLYDENNPSVYTYVNNFIPRHTGSLSLSGNTKVYGIFPFNFNKIEAFRHVLSPSISFSWKPDYSKNLFGYNFNYFQWIDGEPYDKFAGSMAGGTSKQEQKTMSFNLNNQFQAKISDIENSYKKIDLFNWNISSSYNFAADSLNLSPIRSSIRTTLPGGFKLDISLTHDLYKLKLDSTNYLRKINHYGKPRLTSASCGTSVRLLGKQITYSDSINNINKNINQNLWESSLSFRYALNQSIYGDKIQNNKTFWMNSSFKIKITEKWSVQHTARFDLVTYEMLYHKFHISRPLHCWIFSFDWTPSGPSKGFYLKINVKNPDLQDIKLESRGGRSFYGF